VHLVRFAHAEPPPACGWGVSAPQCRGESWSCRGSVRCSTARARTRVMPAVSRLLIGTSGALSPLLCWLREWPNDSCNRHGHPCMRDRNDSPNQPHSVPHVTCRANSRLTDSATHRPPRRVSSSGCSC
jgi:hypothetical protein